MRFECPFCGNEMPPAYEPSNWACCGKAGRAVRVPTWEDRMDYSDYPDYAIVTTINVGLKGNDGSVVSAFDVYSWLARSGHRFIRNVYDADSDEGESTLVLETEYAVPIYLLLELCEKFHQDCVAVHVWSRNKSHGALVGPKSHEWGAFNPDFFLTFDGEPLSSIKGK